MAALGSRFVTKQTEWHANLTERDHLGRALMIAPHKMMDKVNQLFSAYNYYSNNPLSTMLQGIKGGEITIAGTEWEWEMMGADTRPLVVLEKVEPDDNLKPGQYKRRFKIKLDENWYKTTDVITPGTSSKKYNCVIVDGPIRSGDGYIYTLQLLTTNEKDFLPPALLKPGQQWTKGYSISGEAAEKGGSTQFSMPLAFRNKLSKFRKEYMITDYASTEVLRVGLPDANGNIQKSWLRYADMKFFKQWYEELEYARWYAKSADVYQDNGRPYQTGPGIQEQLEDSHVEYYNQLSVSLIDQYLMDIFYGRVAPGSEGRNITAFTGEYGMAAFHEAVSDVMQKRGLIKNIEVFTDKVNSPYAKNAYAYGMQFVQYNLTNGGSLKLVHNPLYDNRKIHTEVDPISGRPVESMRFTFLDFAGEAGKSNIKVTKKEGGDFFTYVCGNYTPYGPAKRNAFASHAGDYYEMHIGGHEGIHIEDVTKCGELIYAVN
jgi:hypothetical protein